MPNIIEISDFSSPDLDVFARLTEPQLCNRREKELGIFIVESPKIIGLALDAGCEPIALLMSEMSRAELTEAILAAVHEINIENAEKREPVYTLAGMLSTKNITSLQKLGKLYKVSGFSKMDKATIIPALIEKMTDINMFTELLFMAAEFEWKLFKQAAKVKHVLNDDFFSENYQCLLKLGVLGMYYYDDHFYYVIPAEIQQAYKKLAAAGFPAEKEHADLLNAYAIAAANLYGVISQDDFVKLFNSQNKHKTNILLERWLYMPHIAKMKISSPPCLVEEYQALARKAAE